MMLGGWGSILCTICAKIEDKDVFRALVFNNCNFHDAAMSTDTNNAVTTPIAT